jgi:hypothetical protein
VEGKDHPICQNGSGLSRDDFLASIHFEERQGEIVLRKALSVKKINLAFNPRKLGLIGDPLIVPKIFGQLHFSPLGG